MDRLADDKQAISSDSNSSKHVYKMHDSSSSSSNAYPIQLCVNTSNNNNNNNKSNNNNNNNNEKMNDANQTLAMTAASSVAAVKTPTSVASNAKFTSSLRQDSINSDLSPLTESVQMMNDGSDGGGSGGGGGDLNVDATDDEYSSVNDNQSNASSDERASSDNNSTDNISFVSEDIVENIIVLPNNFLSEDDESTNSDDVVYAYRGADIGDRLNGIGNGGDNLNADDETDFLEMDFEPDPASEIEAPERIEPMLPLPPLNCITTAPLSGFNVSAKTLAKQSDVTVPDRNMERTGVHKSWLAPIDVRHANGIYATNENHAGRHFVNIHTATNNNNNKSDVDGVNAAASQVTVAGATAAANSIEHESNKSLEIKKMMSNSLLAAAAVAQKNDDLNLSSPYYDNTVSLSTKKYTGTIPKTINNSKLQLLVRPTKTRAADCNGARGESQGTTSCSTPPPLPLVGLLDLRSTSSNQANKRWKITDRTVENPPLASTCDSFDGVGGGDADCSHAKHPTAVVRSMSFPYATNDSSYQRMIAIRCEPTDADNDVGQPASVTFESTYCNIETIVKALVRSIEFQSNIEF